MLHIKKARSGDELNGVSYKQLRSRSRNVVFNNGEPLNLAVRKMALQFLLILAVLVAVSAVFFAKNLLMDKLTDDSVLTLSMNSKYKEPVSFGKLGKPSAEGKNGLAVLAALSDWAGVDLDKISARAGGADVYPSTMEYTLKQNLKNFEISEISGVGNYDFLTEIYSNLAKGNAVVVAMASPRDVMDKSTYEISYAAVKSFDPADNQITVLTSFGRSDTLSADGFIASTRFRSYHKSLAEKLAFNFNLYENNTAFFISNNNDESLKTVR